MKRPPRVIALALCLSALAPNVPARQTPGQPKKPAPKKAAASKEADPMAEVRRNTAVSVVSTLAEEARAFGDPILRARVQARAADALWDTEKERARALFRRAWEAAEAADRENERLSPEERRARAVARGGAGAQNLPNMRRQVVKPAAKRDPPPGEEFL